MYVKKGANILDSTFTAAMYTTEYTVYPAVLSVWLFRLITRLLKYLLKLSSAPFFILYTTYKSDGIKSIIVIFICKLLYCIYFKTLPYKYFLPPYIFFLYSFFLKKIVNVRNVASCCVHDYIWVECSLVFFLRHSCRTKTTLRSRIL